MNELRRCSNSRANAQLDLGRVFDEEKNAILHKWLLLSDPEDPTSSAKGYVKVCVVIIGPGDEPPVAFEKCCSVLSFLHLLYNILQGPKFKCTVLVRTSKCRCRKAPRTTSRRTCCVRRASCCDPLCSSCASIKPRSCREVRDPCSERSRSLVALLRILILLNIAFTIEWSRCMNVRTVPTALSMYGHWPCSGPGPHGRSEEVLRRRGDQL